MNLCFLSIWGIVFAVLGAIFLRADQAELVQLDTESRNRWPHCPQVQVATENYASLGVMFSVASGLQRSCDSHFTVSNVHEVHEAFESKDVERCRKMSKDVESIVKLCGGFLFTGIFPYKPSIVGYPHLWKPPCEAPSVTPTP